MHHWAERAVSAAKVLGDPSLLAAALAMPALADAMTGPTDRARSHRSEAAALVDELSDEELSLRPDAASWLAAAELYLDLYSEADAHGSRAAGLARATGRGDPCSACIRSCPGFGTCAPSWPRPPNSSTAPSRPGAWSGLRRLSPGTSSPLRRRSRRRRSRPRARHRRRGSRAHAPPRRRLRHGLGCGEAG